tara:strand:- start:455 stop:1000 length:546 start_codon:yes stop_codon:yes gene_type:complete
MVDSVKNYGIAGVSATVELGKAGKKIVGSASDISLKNANNSLSPVDCLAGTADDQAVTKLQMDTATSSKVQTITETVNYNSGANFFLFTVSANTKILNVMVTKATNWSSYNATTEITVGDSGDTDRLFSGFQADGEQYKIDSGYTYASETDILAQITQGGATTGTATIEVFFSGPTINQVQ